MNPVVKQEVIRLGFSLLFMMILLSVCYFALPKIGQKMGGAQADAFWTRERKANAKRLFGQEEDE